MISKDTLYYVKNRSASTVIYRIPELNNLRRSWTPGEIKKISFNEMEQLSYQPGGRELMANFLQVVDEAVTEDLGIHREPEYNMSEAEIVKLIREDSLDAFLDALDFAPIGVIDLIKKFSVSLPITDIDKRAALLEKTGFNVDKAIENDRLDKQSEEGNSAQPVERRVKPAENQTPGRRTTGKEYKIVGESTEK